MEPSFIQFISTAAGTSGLAAFAIYLLNQARKDMQVLVSQYAAENREDKMLLLKALDDNSKSNTLLNAKVDNALAMLLRNGSKTS